MQSAGGGDGLASRVYAIQPEHDISHLTSRETKARFVSPPSDRSIHPRSVRMQYYATIRTYRMYENVYFLLVGVKTHLLKKCLFWFKQISASSNHFLFFPRHRLLTSNLQKCWMDPMVLWPAEWKCSQFLSLFFLLRPSVRACGSGCDTHYNAVCRVCVCVYVYQLLNWPARSSVVPSGLSLKILAQQLFFSRLQFFRVPHHHHSAARLFFVFLFLADSFFIIIWWNRVWNYKK